jgi:hypothetical protein
MQDYPPTIHGFHYRAPGLGPIILAAFGLALGVGALVLDLAPYIAAIIWSLW